MDFKRIEELLSRYWNCETSLEEEQKLRAYFQITNVPDQLKETANLFKYFDAQKKKSLNDPAFDTTVIKKANLKNNKTISLFYNSMRIAAGISVLLVAVWFVRSEVRKTTPQQMVDTYDDPKLAFEETKKALLMISKSFGTVEEQAKKINLFNEAQEEISKKEKKKIFKKFNMSDLQHKLAVVAITIYKTLKNEIMKKIIIAAVLIATMNGVFAQDAISKFFSKYQNDESFSQVTVSSKMFALFTNMDAETAEDKDILEAISKLKGLRILAKEDTRTSRDLYKEAFTLIPMKDYEELMSVRDKDKDMKFLIKESGGKVSELLMVLGGTTQFMVMSLYGEIDLKQVSRIGKKMNVSGLEHLEKMNKGDKEKKQ